MPVSDQGLQKDRYQLIPRVLIFVTSDETVLLLKGSPTKKIWPNLYNGIGGHVEQGENILHAAKREFLEETGVELIKPWLCAVVSIDTGKKIGIGMHVFRGEIVSDMLTDSEEGELEWIPLNKIEDYPLVEDLPILIPHVMTQIRGDQPVFLHYAYDEANQLLIYNEEGLLS